MKKIFALIVITLALLLGMPPNMVRSQATKPGEIPWLTSFDSALQLAKQQGKPILLDFYNPK